MPSRTCSLTKAAPCAAYDCRNGNKQLPWPSRSPAITSLEAVKCPKHTKALVSSGLCPPRTIWRTHQSQSTAHWAPAALLEYAYRSNLEIAQQEAEAKLC